MEALSRGARSVDFVEKTDLLPFMPSRRTWPNSGVKNRVENRARLFKKDVFAFLDGMDRTTAEGPRTTWLSPIPPIRPGPRTVW